MSVLVSPGSLESGLRTLRRSKLMSQEEFKDMYGAIERHHRDLKLAHLTGKAKDLMVKAQKDTRFYNILVSMLCDVRQQQQDGQKNALKKVHNWYQANKHTLYSTSRFGKDQQKLEAREAYKAIRRRKTTSSVILHHKSAATTPTSHTKVNENGTADVFDCGIFSGVDFMEEDTQSISRHNLNNHSMCDQVASFTIVDTSRFLTNHDESFADGPEKELQNLNVSLDDEESRATISVHIRNSGDDDQLFSPNVSGSRDRNADGKIDSPSNMEQSGRRRKLLRSQTPTTSIRTALREQSPNIPLGLPKRMVHSISSLVNPHAQLTAMEVRVAEEEQAGHDNSDTRVSFSKPGQQVQFQNGKMPVMRPVTVAGSRADNILRWKGFARDMSYGQDILGKLDFVGRSGTALDVRYTAHGLGEMPEHLTNHVLAQYRHGTEMESNVDDNDIQSDMMKQTLEEFYQTTDGINPAKLPKYRPPSVRRTKTPKEEKTEKERRPSTVKTPRIQPLGKQLLEHFEQGVQRPETRGPEISLDTVFNMIDTVTEDMNYFKEKLAPTPQPGFRQPANNGVSRNPLSRPTTSQSQRSSSPVQRSNTPAHEQTRAPSNPFSSRDIMFSSQDEVNGYVSKSPLPGSNVVQAIDWRGKIAPDTIRYKWAKTKFGGHTYVKKLMNRPSMRSAGTSRAGKRPKTAPLSARDRWNTVNKPSDQNVRIAQAATNTMMLVDQKSVDSMMVIQHILGTSDSRMGSLGSLFLDLEYLKASNIRQRPLQPTCATPEYVTDMCTNAPMSAGGSRAQSRLSRCSESRADFVPSQLPEKEVSIATDEQLPLVDNVETTQTDQVAPAEITCHVPLVEKSHTKSSNISLSGASSKNQIDIDSLLTGEKDETYQAVQEGSEVGEKVTVTEETSLRSEKFPDNKEIVLNSETQVKDKTNSNFKLVSPQKEKEDVLIRITSVSSKEKGSSKPPLKQKISQILTKSEVWQYSPDDEIEKDVDQSKGIKSILANQSDSALYFHGNSTGKPETYYSDCSTQSMSAKVGRSAGRMPRGTDSVPVQVLKMAKKQSEFFEKVPPVRTPPSIPSPHHPLGGRSQRHERAYSVELEQHARRMNSPRNFMKKKQKREFDELRKEGSRSAPPVSSRMDKGLASTLHVCHLPIPGRTQTAPMFQLEDEEYFTKPQPEPEPMIEDTLECGDEHVTSPRRVAFRSPNENDNHKSIAQVGRPIAQICQVPDPDSEATASAVLREAKAVVDIQRIFRGYVARNIYKKLLKEERERLEDEREAAIMIQRCYRGHLARSSAIYNRPIVKAETLTWVKEYRGILVQKAIERQVKMDAIAKKNTLNHKKASAKISVIGPHVNIYQIYHPKHIGPTKEEIFTAAILIQKHARGLFVRKRFEKLRKKAIWYGSNWKSMVRDYKRTLIRVQRWHGREKVSCPFSLEEMHEYMDLRRRYESVFDKRGFGGELDLIDLEQYLHECDLYPSMSEIEEAMNVVFRGKPLKKRGLHKQEVLDLIFYIYIPKATGLTNTRQSTWMNPIINGTEARKLMGSEYVEDAPLNVCAKLVINSKRERREKEQKEMMHKLEEEDKLQEAEELRQEKEKQRASRAKLLDGQRSPSSADSEKTSQI